MIISFAVQKLLSLTRFHLFILVFVAIAFGVLLMKSLYMPIFWMVLPKFSSRAFFFFSFLFYCILGFGVHVKNMQDCCIGTHMAVWFAAFLPITYIWLFFPWYLSPTPHPLLSLLYFPPTDPSVWCSPPCVYVFSFSTPTYEWEHAVFNFLFLCQFAESDGFQAHPCPSKGHKLIVLYGCIIFHGVYVPHFPSPVYHWWAFGLVPSLCQGKQCCSEHMFVYVCIIEWFIVLWIYTQ